ncbi:MarR family transcriptional regulator [Streptomyces xanthophaeus]
MGSMSHRQNWTFLTNHARVLVTLARDPGVRLRDVAAVCQLTERTVQTIVTDLEADGYLRRVRDGRRNRYEISTGAVFRHPAEAGVQVAGLLALLTGAAADPDAPSLAPDVTAPEATDLLDLPTTADPAPAPASTQDRTADLATGQVLTRPPAPATGGPERHSGDGRQPAQQ